MSLQYECWMEKEVTSPAEYITLLAGAVVSLGQVVTVLSAVAVVMAVCTLVLFWTVKERPAAVSQGANALTHTFEKRVETCE